MAKKVVKISVLLFAFLCIWSAFCAVPNFEPDERITRQMASSQTMEADIFARAALIASGASNKKIEAHLSTLLSLANELSSVVRPGLSDEQKAEAALSFIYNKKLISKYKFEQTRLDTALETGVYNCVSSAVLFMFFAKKLGVPVVAVETPNHAFCTIIGDGQKIDVETTNPYGVKPGKKRQDELSNRYIVVPVTNYRGRKDVDDRRLVSIIYQNRIAELQRAKKNADTIALATDAWAMQDASDVSLQMLSDCVCNYASDLIKARREEEALELAQKASMIFGETKGYSATIQTAAYNLLLRKVKTVSLDEAVQAINDNKDILSKKDRDSLVGFAYGQKAQDAGARHDWAGGIALVREGLAQVPNDSNLKKLLTVFNGNYAVDFHNKAAELYNSGDKASALSVLRQGLEIIPDSAMLKNDLSRMKQ